MTPLPDDEPKLPPGTDPQVAAEAEALLAALLERMGISPQISTRWVEGRLVLDALCGEDDKVAIGRKGHTLEAIQHIYSLMLRRRFLGELRATVDIGGYRERRQRNLRETALRSAAAVRDGGEPVVIGPYRAFERHVIHAALQGDEAVVTQSLGEGEEKQIIIRLREADAPEGR
jgi:spoIIIJ-associated protein